MATCRTRRCCVAVTVARSGCHPPRRCSKVFSFRKFGTAALEYSNLFSVSFTHKDNRYLEAELFVLVYQILFSLATATVVVAIVPPDLADGVSWVFNGVGFCKLLLVHVDPSFVVTFGAVSLLLSVLVQYCCTELRCWCRCRLQKLVTDDKGRCASRGGFSRDIK